MHRKQKPQEQFHVSDAMDPRDLDCRVMWDHSYEASPPSPGSPWRAVIPRPPRTSLAQYVLSSNVIDVDEGCQSTSALQEHSLALHQMTLTQEVVDPSDPAHLEPLTSPDEMTGKCPS